MRDYALIMLAATNYVQYYAGIMYASLPICTVERSFAPLRAAHKLLLRPIQDPVCMSVTDVTSLPERGTRLQCIP